MATMTMTADPEDQGGGWWWPFKKKNPSGNNKGGGGNGAEAKPNIGRFLGVTLSVLGCTALAVSGFAIPALLSLLPSLWVGHSFGAAYDEAKHIEVQEKQKDLQTLSAQSVEESEKDAKEILAQSNQQAQENSSSNKQQNPQDQYVETEPFFEALERQGRGLSDEQKKVVRDEFPEGGASVQELKEVVGPLLEQNAQASKKNSETKADMPTDKPKDNPGSTDASTEAEKTSATLAKETDPNYLALSQLANAMRDNELGIG
jgi:hypothetical protein